MFYEPTPAGFGHRGSKKSSSAVVREGHRFEGKVFDALVAGAESKGWILLPEFCFTFKTGKLVTTKAYVDILAINPRSGCIAIIEAKRTHTADSYNQIWKYMALAKSYFGDCFAVIGYEVCLYQGLSLEYPGPHRWLSPGQMVAESWNGYGFPSISIVPWYTGKFYL
jgi:hypothetical protein